MIRIWLSCIFLLMPSFAFGSGFSLSLDPGSKASPWERLKLEEYLRKTEGHFPEGMKNTIGENVVVRFVDFPEDEPAPGIVPPPCSPGDPHVQQTLGRAVEEKNGQKVVLLNRKLIQEITYGAEGSKSFSCGHKNTYRLAQAALLHEVAHVYDNKAKVSGRPTFINRMNFKKPFWGLGSYQSKNNNASRSPDPYELTNPEEAFAVNFEFYSLDPEFSCRRPSTQLYYDEVFEISSKAQPSCKPDTEVKVRDSVTSRDFWRDIDPKRVYSIDYLLADKGPDFASRWGHAMFRIVLCAPDTKEVGPACRKDVNSHVVVSYRANPNDIILSQLKGLTGGYENKQFLLTLPSVLEEYNRGERRDIISLPLKLSEKEKADFLYQVLERDTSYATDYYFLNRNCATESRDLFKGVGTQDQKEIQSISALTPTGLYDDLAAAGVLDKTLLDDTSDLKNTYLFKSETAMILNAFERVRGFAENKGVGPFAQGTCRDVSPFLTETTAADREVLYSTLSSLKKEPSDPNLLADFLVLENEAYRYNAAKLRNEVWKVIYQLHDDPSAVAENLRTQGQALLKRLNLSELLRNSGNKDLKTGYGIPLAADFAQNPAWIAEKVEAQESASQIASFLELVNKAQPGFAEKEKSKEVLRDVSAQLVQYLSTLKNNPVVSK